MRASILSSDASGTRTTEAHSQHTSPTTFLLMAEPWPEGDDPDWLLPGEEDEEAEAEGEGENADSDNEGGDDHVEPADSLGGNAEVISDDEPPEISLAPASTKRRARKTAASSIVRAAPTSRSSRVPTSMLGLLHSVLVSLTVTPSTSRFNVPLALAVQLKNAQALHGAVGNALDAASTQGVRLLNGKVARFIVSIEAGKRRGKYHLQGAIVVETIERNLEMVMFALTQLMSATIAAVGLSVRITKQIKPVHFKDEYYLVGYVQKDAGLEHYADRVLGYDAEALERGVREHRTKGGSTTYSSDKINQFPDKDRRAVGLNAGNLLQVARWFMLKEGLRALLSVASIAVQTAWLLQTNNYVLETQIINGVKGAALDEARLEALNLLNNNPCAREHVSLIRCVLYGPESMQVSANMRHVQAFMNPVFGLPSAAECEKWQLFEAKRFCQQTAPEDSNLPSRANEAMASIPAIGVAVVIDLAGSFASQYVATALAQQGFTVNKLFATNQCIDGCGHLAEMSAVLLRARGDCFNELRLEEVQAVNTYPCIMMQQGKIIRSSTEMPERLSDMQILHLATLDNPDDRGTAPSWLPGPGPMNAFDDALRESAAEVVTEADAIGSQPVHIMIVNSIRVNDLSAEFVGEHWITVAWQRRTSAP